MATATLPRFQALLQVEVPRLVKAREAMVRAQEIKKAEGWGPGGRRVQANSRRAVTRYFNQAEAVLDAGTGAILHEGVTEGELVALAIDAGMPEEPAEVMALRAAQEAARRA